MKCRFKDPSSNFLPPGRGNSERTFLIMEWLTDRFCHPSFNESAERFSLSPAVLAHRRGRSEERAGVRIPPKKISRIEPLNQPLAAVY